MTNDTRKERKEDRAMRFERQTSSDAPLKQAAHHLAMRAYVPAKAPHLVFFGMSAAASPGSARLSSPRGQSPRGSVPLARVAIVRAVQPRHERERAFMAGSITIGDRLAKQQNPRWVGRVQAECRQ